MSNHSETIYCFDTSAFINSWHRYHTPKVFPAIWEKISELVKSGRIIVCKEVQKEINNGNDDLKTWFRSVNSCVQPYDTTQFGIVAAIVNKYPKVSHYNKPKPVHADPFVIALAKVKNATVVTWEGGGGDPLNPKIPSLCKENGVDSCNMIQFFEKEGWTF